MLDFPYQDDEIEGVLFKFLVSHHDARGFFREIIRCTDQLFGAENFAQWSHSKMSRDVVKAWHYHHLQYDWWYVPIGQIETVLVDHREESPTFRKKLVMRMGERETYGKDTWDLCVRIPPGVLHGCRVLSPAAHLFYITSEIYNPGDEGRLPFDSALIGHDWGAGALTAENDRRTFIPVNKRKMLAGLGTAPKHHP